MCAHAPHDRRRRGVPRAARTGRGRPFPRGGAPDGAAAGLLLLSHRRRADPARRGPSLAGLVHRRAPVHGEPAAARDHRRRRDRRGSAHRASGRDRPVGPCDRLGSPLAQEGRSGAVGRSPRPARVPRVRRPAVARGAVGPPGRGAAPRALRSRRSVAPGAGGPDRVRGRRRGGAGLRGQPGIRGPDQGAAAEGVPGPGNRGPPPAGRASARRRPLEERVDPCLLPRNGARRAGGTPLRRRDPQGQSLAAPSRPAALLAGRRRHSPGFLDRVRDGLRNPPRRVPRRPGDRVRARRVARPQRQPAHARGRGDRARRLLGPDPVEVPRPDRRPRPLLRRHGGIDSETARRDRREGAAPERARDRADHPAQAPPPGRGRAAGIPCPRPLRAGRRDRRGLLRLPADGRRAHRGGARRRIRARASHGTARGHGEGRPLDAARSRAPGRASSSAG